MITVFKKKKTQIIPTLFNTHTRTVETRLGARCLIAGQRELAAMY